MLSSRLLALLANLIVTAYCTIVKRGMLFSTPDALSWHSAIHAGDHMLHVLNAALYEGGRDAEPDFNRYRFQHTRRIDSGVHLVPFSALKAHSGPMLLDEIAVYVKEPDDRLSDKPAPYRNFFNADLGLMVLVENHKGLDAIRPNGVRPMKPRLHLSDILLHCYRSLGHNRPSGNAAPLRFIVRREIVNRDTEGIIREAYKRNKGKVEKGAEHEWQPHSEEFRAMMGTIHGKGVAHLLKDHARYLGHKRVQSIVTVHGRPEDGAGSPEEWSMMFKLRTAFHNLRS